MIVVTGAAGFIGSCVSLALSKVTDEEVVLVDNFSRMDKARNLDALIGFRRVERMMFFDWLNESHPISAIIHLGARTDTMEFDQGIFDHLNVNYSKKVWDYCVSNNVPLIYASSAATYGSGELGYDDNHNLISQLKPLNPYGESKQAFDLWVLEQKAAPKHWYGLKFFNVYGPNENHKERMASVVFHAFKKIKETGAMQLFKSHNEAYKDGEQLRDFVYVKDVVRVILFLLESKPENGLYNLGTGGARTFLDLTKAVFDALNLTHNISFVDTPKKIRDKYQYYTQANISKLRKAGFASDFIDIERGVKDYVENYLLKEEMFDGSTEV